MDCREAQEQILESLTEPRLDDSSDVLDDHILECDGCRSFLETQRNLDLQLSRAISAPILSPGFRKSVMENVRRKPNYVWTESLPDKAHLAGCLCAIVLSIWVLPFSADSMLLIGSVFTVATFFIHSVVWSALQNWEEGQQ